MTLQTHDRANLAGRFQLKNNLLNTMIRTLCHNLLKKITYGNISFILPDGSVISSHTENSGPNISIQLNNYRSIKQLIVGGGIGFSESYVDGDWDCSDLPTLIEILALNGESLAKKLQAFLPLLFINKIIHRLKANSKNGSLNNIGYHYDLGNEFYQKWLDTRMLYSSAIYISAAENIEDAQLRKLNKIFQLLNLSEGDEVLEIGCGWGGLALYLANKQNILLDGITLSKEQLIRAKSITHEVDTSSIINLSLTDYRDVHKKYDRVVSIEMIEAVGEEYLSVYFDKIKECLKPGGTAVIQAITIDEDRFERYKRSPDFIQKHIFPGGFLTTKTMMHELAKNSELELYHAEYFGTSYAKTLRQWRANFLSSWPEIHKLGYDSRFKRMWDYYLAYCEGGFMAKSIDVGLYVYRA